MQAKVTWSGQRQFAGTGNGGHSVLMDGENKAGNSPMELVVMALCGCTAYDVVSILQKKRDPFTAIEVSAEAEKAPDPPRVFTVIKLLYRVRGKVNRKAVEDAVHLSEKKYCSVSAMLNKTATITYKIELDSQ